MKNLILIISLFSNFALAGNGGGTMMIVSQDKLNQKLSGSKPIVFDMGSNSEVSKFAYGEYDGKTWNINRVESIETIDFRILEAVIRSKQTKNWVEAK